MFTIDFLLKKIFKATPPQKIRFSGPPYKAAKSRFDCITYVEKLCENKQSVEQTNAQNKRKNFDMEFYR